MHTSKILIAAYSRQKKHFSPHAGGISLWQWVHIRPFSRMAVHVWQKSLRRSVLLSGAFMRWVTIWSIRAITSVSSIAMRLPLSRPTYLLTADCDKPRRSAVCFSFKPCFSRMDLAIIAFTAGRTVFTPTSHGSIKFYTNYSYFWGKCI
jgi:hypothetical protein